jgi:hypothetical protein
MINKRVSTARFMPTRVDHGRLVDLEQRPDLAYEDKTGKRSLRVHHWGSPAGGHNERRSRA